MNLLDAAVSPFEPTATARLTQNGEWLIDSSACYRTSTPDEAGYKAVRLEPVADDVLGVTLRNALNQSRLLTLEEAKAMFARENSESRYERWVAWAMVELGATNRKRLFEQMRRCHVVRRLDVIEISPMRKTRGEGWVGLDDPHVIVRCHVTGSDNEVGHALRFAMDRAVA